MRKMTPFTLHGKNSAALVLSQVTGKPVDRGTTQAPSLKFLQKSAGLSKARATKLLGGP